MMKRMVGAALTAAFGLVLFAGPSFSQTGYPPGPATTSTVPPTVTVPPLSGTVAPPTTAVARPPAVAQPLIVAQSPPKAAAVPAGRFVALTGANVLRWVLTGLVLMMAGAVLITVARRRRARSGDLVS